VIALVFPVVVAAVGIRLPGTIVEGIPLVKIPAGSFAMGSPSGEPGRGDDENLHRVSIPRTFWLGKTEITQRQWTRVMRSNPSAFRRCGPECPVENVSALDVERYLGRLNARAGGGFRLPTEAEWEYACRAGAEASPTATDRSANFDARYPAPGGTPGRYRGRTARVATFRPNTWGLFDMLGNVWEWCADSYGPYPGTPAGRPEGASAPAKRVIRGGSWYFDGASARCSARYTHDPRDRGFSLGFRVARDDR